MNNKLIDGKKIPDTLENPIDVVIINIGRKMFPFFRKLGFTANGLTTISLILGLGCCYSFYNKFYKFSALLYFVSYIFDVLDGNYARTYQIVSKFGDYYDHYKDLLVNILLLGTVITYHTYSSRSLIIVLGVTLILFMTLYLHLGCQEIYVTQKNKMQNSEYLSRITIPKSWVSYMSILRYGGCGTFALWVSIILWNNS
jgi:phosphatidylglycerophosphate synthase